MLLGRALQVGLAHSRFMITPPGVLLISVQWSDESGGVDNFLEAIL
jgi:hypothetical protein